MSTWKKFVAYGCSHGDLVDDEVVSFLQKFISDYKPDHSIHLGDAWDYRALRRGVGATDPDAFQDFEADVTKGHLTLERLGTNVLTLGNHDWRLHDLAGSYANAITKMAARDGVKHLEKWAKQAHCKLLPYHAEDGVFRLAEGNAAFVHGYTANNNSVREHANHYAAPGGILVMAHLHAPEFSPAKKHGGCEGYCVGMIGDLKRMDYASRRFATSRWGNAFVYGEHKGPLVSARLVVKKHGRWLL